MGFYTKGADFIALIDNWDKLFATVKSDVLSVMQSMDTNWTNDNDNPKYVMMQHVDTDVYQSYVPRFYHQTFQLRDSITATRAKKSGSEIIVGLYHDKNKMDYDPENYVHGSPGWDIRYFLPEIIDHGASGTPRWGANQMFPADGAWRRDTMYIQNTVSDLQSGRFQHWLSENMRERGYIVI